jgi:DNA-binding NtrC family response regulator
MEEIVNQEPIHIIVVDDEEDARIIFKFNFKKEVKKGLFYLHYFESAQEVLDFLCTDEGKKVSLLLSDINMPEMDGLKLLEIVSSKYTNLDVYMISAYGTEEYTARAKELGALDFFTKPVDFNDLKKTICANYKIDCD